MRIYLDDLRNPPLFDSLTGEPVKWDQVVRNGRDMIALVETGKISFISFDHDLGENTPTGYDVAKRIEALAAAGKIKPIDYTIHSANPVGANNIDAAMKSAWRFWEKS
jgi:hypothetical protein